MGNVFSGLESLGLVGVSSVSIYDEEKKDNAKKETAAAPEKVITESDFLFEKKLTCPVCDKEFKTKTVKTGKPRLIGSDSDLRPKYAGIDSIKYDAIICPNCGYGALSRFFGYMTSVQAKLIKETVSSQFSKLPDSGDTYTYDEAINRHKLALFNSVVKRSKVSERAYTCLKLAWLYRGKKENLDMSALNAKDVKAECEANEKEMISNAFEGFVTARAKEDFPVCGMDESTFEYLLADLAARLEKYDLAVKFATNVITTRQANTKLKEKARDLRDRVKSKLGK